MAIDTKKYMKNTEESKSNGYDTIKIQRKRKKPVIFIIIMLALIGALIFYYLNESERTNLPSYINDFVVYNEGVDGIVIYFILADESGQPKAYDGWAWLMIRCKGDLIFCSKRKIRYSDFHSTTIGRGLYERKSIIYSYGRIPYSSLNDSWRLSGKRAEAELLFIGGKIPFDVNEKPILLKDCENDAMLAILNSIEREFYAIKKTADENEQKMFLGFWRYEAKEEFYFK